MSKALRNAMESRTGGARVARRVFEGPGQHSASLLRSRNQALFRLGIVAFSVTYFFVTLGLGAELLSFVSANAMETRSRSYMVAWLAFMPAVVIAAGNFVAQRHGAAGIAWLVRTSRLTLPLIGAAALPALLRPGASDDRELAFLAVAALTAWVFERTTHSAPELVSAGARALSWAGRGSKRIWDGAAAVAIISFVAATGLASVRLHNKLLTSNFDLGLFENLFYNTLQGRHGLAIGRAYFGEHAEFLLYPLLPIYALVPRAETLLLLQSAFLGGAAVPIYLLGRRWIGGAASFVVVVIYLLYPAVHGPNFYDFHFLTLSVCFVTWAAYCFVRRRWRPFWILVILALSCREDVALGVAAVGVGLARSGWHRRVGLALSALGSVWFLLVKFVWMARYGDQAFSHYYADLIPRGERGFLGMSRTLVTNPLLVIFNVLVPEKLTLALHLLVPLAFSPVRQWRTAFLLVPGFIVLGLSTSRAAVLQIHFHYVCHFVPYLFIAFLIALAVRRRNARVAILTGSLVATAACTVQFGAAFRERYKASFHEVSFAWTANDDARSSALQALTSEIPPTASVAAGEYEGPHVARRRDLFSVKDGIRDADFVLVGTQSLRWGGKEAVVEAMRSGAYGVKSQRDEFVLLARNAETSRNAETIDWLDSHPPR